MIDNEIIKAFNYAAYDNNVTIKFCSSSKQKCQAKNILSDDRKSLWVSESGVPQVIVLDLSKMKKRPRGHFQYWGIFCWHAFSTNPKKIEIEISANNLDYFSLGEYMIKMKPGMQLFSIDKKNIRTVKRVNYIKIIVKETYASNGDSRTYLNQFYLFDDTASVDISEVNEENKEIEGQSFFNSNNFKEESYMEEEEPSIQPITPMEQVISDEISSEEDKKENKLTKILKTKTKPTTISTNEKTNNIDSYLPSKVMTKGRTLFFSNTNTINRERASTPNITSHTITYSNNKRTMTPVRNISELIFNSPKEEEKKENDLEEQLEQQLKEMQNHIEIMKADTGIDITETIPHSKSFSFIRKDNNSNANITSDFPLKSEFNSIIPSSNRVEQLPILSALPPSVPLTTKKLEETNKENEKIKSLEEKVSSLENEIKEIKISFNQFSKDIKDFITEAANAKQHQSNVNIEEIISIALRECNKMIETKYTESQSQYNQYMKSTQHNPIVNVSTESNINSFEMKLNQKIEEKFELLANNIENQICKEYLQPSIQQIESQMKDNLNEIKEKLNNLAISNNNLTSQSNTSSFIESYRMNNRSNRSSINEGRLSTQKRNEKLEEMKNIGERLLSKLEEKDKKLRYLTKQVNNI